MEARSLGSLNYLAANPPQYPTNPTEHKQEPLVLYISRVPGTQDVILSPFRPGLKNVTAQDVASSFYYVHYELPSTASASADFPPPPPIHDEFLNRSDSDGYSERSIHIPRKPLPQHAAPSTHDDSQLDTHQLPPPPPPVPPHHRTGGLLLHHEQQQRQPRETYPPPSDPPLERRPLPSQANIHPALRARANTGPRQGLDEGLPPFESKTIPTLNIVKDRSPTSSRPLSAVSSLVDEKALLADTHFLTSGDVDPPEIPPRPSGAGRALPPLPTERQNTREVLYRREGSRDDPRATSMQGQYQQQKRPSELTNSVTAYRLTLIRRDPVSGHQWNVGSISSSSQQIHPSSPPYSTSDSQHHAHSQSASYPSINVQIENTGYDKFRGTEMSSFLTAEDAAAALGALTGHGDERISMSKEGAAMLLQSGNSTLTSPPGIFKRQIEMAYQKSWTSTLKDKIHQIDRQGWKEKSKNFIKGRPVSIDSYPSQNSRAPVSTESSDVARMKPRGYTFTSPWSGQCEFVTGTTGRSLKCFHTLRDNGSYNPLVNQHSHGSGGDQDGGSSPPKHSSGIVSELRFNLPRSDKLSSSSAHHRHYSNDSSVGPNSNSQRIRGHFSKLLGQGSTSSSNSDIEDGYSHDDELETDVVSPFEINLGAEKAGGGIRGKRAKLGKLIIHGEGLKMLDLVVAANMGVWWGAWERTQS